MATHQVIATSRTSNTEQSITHLWVSDSEAPYSVDDVIAMLARGHIFQVGVVLPATVEAMPPAAPTYVRTKPDGLPSNNLLSLPIRAAPGPLLGSAMAVGLLDGLPGDGLLGGKPQPGGLLAGLVAPPPKPAPGALTKAVDPKKKRQT